MWLRLVVAAALASGLVFAQLASPAGADPGPCAISTGPTSYQVKVCITAPVNLATVTGSAAVTATVTVTGTSPGVAKLEWSLNGEYLLMDFQSPWTFTLPSADFVDGNYTLAAVVRMRDSFVSSPGSVQLTFNNGVTQPPTNQAQWQPPAVPQRPWGQPTVIAAAGDGAGGETNATSVVNLIDGWDPELFLYLGDVYEDGTLTEFRNWYGTGGTFFDRFRSRTAPVIGNHELDGGGYFPYWDNVPHYYSYDVNGWHFVALDSTSQFGPQFTPGTPQYDWLAADLAATTSPCVVAYAHHPLYTIGAESPATRLQPMFQLMRQHGVTLFLTAHDHNYQHWVPMDGAGSPDPAGVAELVVGTGGHSSIAVKTSDFRVVKQHKSYGALRMALYGNRADFSYTTSTGQVIEQDTFSCKGQDGIAPDVPAAPTVGSVSETTIDLTWPASADNFGVTGYRVYRDGEPLATSPTASYSDGTVAAATSYDYSISALDAAGNESARSPATTAATPGTDVSPPSVPAGIQVTAPLAGVLELSWSPSNDNTGVDHYTVHRDGQILGFVTEPAFSETGLGSAEERCYEITATDAAGNTSGSSALTCGRAVDTTAPTPPSELSAAAVAAGHVRLNWTAASDNVAVTGYDIHRDGVLIDSTNSPAATYDDLTVDSLSTHTYRVAAFDAAGLRSELSGPVSVSTGDGEAPTPPSGPTAVATGPNTVLVSWGAATDNVGVTGYRVFRGGVPIDLVPGGTLSYLDRTALSDTTYIYTVAASDAVGNESAASTGAQVTTPSPSPTIASADTYVSDNNPNTNYGLTTSLRSDADPHRLPYFTFQVTGAQPTITRVRLRVFATTKSTTPITIRGVPSASWGERTITWNNAPALGAVVGTHPSFATPQWIDVDVTSLVAGNGAVSLAIETTSTTSATYASRETTTKPQLLVDSAP